MKKSGVRHKTAVLIRTHTYRGGIDQYPALSNTFFHLYLILKLIHLHLTGSTAVYPVRRFLSSVPGFSLPGNQIDTGRPVKGRLRHNRNSRSACPQEGHLLPGDVISRICDRRHISFSIRVVSGQHPVLLYNRIYRSDKLSLLRHHIRALVHQPFMRHRTVPAPGIQSDQSVHRLIKPLRRYVEGQIYIVQPMIAERIIVHCRRNTMRHRASQQTDQTCTACNLLVFHIFSPSLSSIEQKGNHSDLPTSHTILRVQIDTILEWVLSF